MWRGFHPKQKQNCLGFVRASVAKFGCLLPSRFMPDTRPVQLCRDRAIHRRYTETSFLCVPNGVLQGIRERPVPCNYYVIQPNIALSRR